MPPLSNTTAPTRAAIAVAFLMLAGGQARAQPPDTPFQILDNSFIVEEAFNQEPGIFQNIFGVRLGKGDAWEFAFTQEWPVVSQTHQLSYTISATGEPGMGGLGDMLINYRYQLWVEGEGRPAFSPRLSIVLPTGDHAAGRGAGVVGWQVNLPFSSQQNDLYYHWNVGFTWLPGVRSAIESTEDHQQSVEADLMTPHLSASAIWRARPMFNLMLEALAEFEDQIDAEGATNRTRVLTLAPGFRTGWNVGSQQLVFGFAVPVTFSEGQRDPAAFVYFSYELPFTE